MVDYGLKNRVVIIRGANNPWGIGAATALAFAREQARMITGQVIKVSGGKAL